MRANALLAGLIAACCLMALVASPVSAEQGFYGFRLRGPENWCIAQKTAIDCDLRDECVWCEKPGKKFGTGCYPMKAAKLVPAAWGLVCDKDLDPTAADPRVTAGACDGKPEAACTGPACVWCTSAAVGGGCYTPEEAQLLPKAIFKCKTPTEAVA